MGAKKTTMTSSDVSSEPIPPPQPTGQLAAALSDSPLSEVVWTDDQLSQIERYCLSLWGINQHLNLTRHTTFRRFVDCDLLDSYHLSELLESGERVLDFGTGGGVPGVLLAIIRPDLKVSLSDSVGKKARAVEQIVSDVGLSCPVHPCSLQQVLERHAFDSVVCRAVGPLSKLCDWLAPYWSQSGRLLAIKGPGWVDERATARHRGLLHGLALRRLAHYPTPGRDHESVILQLRPEAQQT
jgi:16S rRNA (guanine527-N7)-methyltransferase